MATKRAAKTVTKTPVKKAAKKATSKNPFAPAQRQKLMHGTDDHIHLLKKGFICDTEQKAFTRPKGKGTIKIVVDAGGGVVRLWAKNTTLNWRFRESSMDYFDNPTSAKNEIRKLIKEMLAQWGTASPVKFKEDNTNWDFEIVMRQNDSCMDGGCVLASAFFPDQGQHRVYLYPFLFEQTRHDQIETLAHEYGHIFGLRHYFALLEEKDSPAEIFGRHNKFTIMNYNELSKLTKRDRTDLTKLYQLTWSGQLTTINGKPIKLVKPFHSISG